MKVNLTKRVSVKRGNETIAMFCPVVISAKNGRIKPDYVKVNGIEEHHPEGTHYLDYYVNGVRKRERAGLDATQAMVLKENKELELKMVSRGMVLSATEPKAEPKPQGASVEEEIMKYLSAVAKNHKHSTVVVYAKALKDFQASLRPEVKTLLDITSSDMVDFEAYLRNERELAAASCFTRFLCTMIFLKSHGLTTRIDPSTGERVKLVPKHAWPQPAELGEPDIYEPDDKQLPLLMAASTPIEGLMWRFFLMTGERKQEVMYTTLGDLVLNNKPGVRVTPKADHHWTPKTKNSSGRVIPISFDLAEELKQVKLIRPNPRQLLFPSEDPNQPFGTGSYLKMLKACAVRAGVNCGYCDGCINPNPQTGCEQWYLHKFRATFATLSLEAGNTLVTVQKWLGHVSLKATSRYLRENRDQATRDRVNSTFTQVLNNSG